MKDKTKQYYSLHELELSEPQPETGTITVLAGVVGKWYHPAGDFEITQSDVENMVNDFNKKKRDLLFDFDHRCLDPFANNSKSAGWGKVLRATEKGLEIDVEFTPAGKQAVENKEYRYLSPVYVMSSNRKDRKVSLHSVALTNIPFLKELPAIVNSEKNETNKQGEMMEELTKLLSCNDESVVEKVKDLINKNSELQTNLSELSKKQAETEIDLAIANNQIKKDQRTFALNLKLKDNDLFNEFLNSNKVEAPQGTIEIPNSSKESNVVKFSELLDNPAKFIEFQEKDPVKFNEMYEKFLNGGE